MYRKWCKYHLVNYEGELEIQSEFISFNQTLFYMHAYKMLYKTFKRLKKKIPGQVFLCVLIFPRYLTLGKLPRALKFYLVDFQLRGKMADTATLFTSLILLLQPGDDPQQDCCLMGLLFRSASRSSRSLSLIHNSYIQIFLLSQKCRQGYNLGIFAKGVAQLVSKSVLALLPMFSFGSAFFFSKIRIFRENTSRPYK